MDRLPTHLVTTCYYITTMGGCNNLLHQTHLAPLLPGRVRQKIQQGLRISQLWRLGGSKAAGLSAVGGFSALSPGLSSGAREGWRVSMFDFFWGGCFFFSLFCTALVSSLVYTFFKLLVSFSESCVLRYLAPGKRSACLECFHTFGRHS